MDAGFCVEALNEAILRYGPPKIFNTDQGSQFTSFKWIDTLQRAGIKISMPLCDFTNHLPVTDGKGRVRREDDSLDHFLFTPHWTMFSPLIVCLQTTAGQ